MMRGITCLPESHLTNNDINKVKTDWNVEFLIVEVLRGILQTLLMSVIKSLLSSCVFCSSYSQA